MNDALRQRALQYLARREHSRAELARKLKPHAESEDEVGVLLDDLAERGLLSDARYVEMRLAARGARYGNARLAHELRRQGVSAELVGDALAAGGDEVARAEAVRRRKFGEERPADAAERARQARFLGGRGFSGETVRRVLRGDFDDN